MKEFFDLSEWENVQNMEDNQKLKAVHSMIETCIDLLKADEIEIEDTKKDLFQVLEVLETIIK